MAKTQKPPRPWDIDDLLDLGRRSDTRHLRAVPVLVLENWLRGNKEEEVANFARTNIIARRLEHSGLVASFKPKGTSVVLASLSRIQNARNLTRPKLIEYQGTGSFRFNLPHYEALLEDYCWRYRERYPDDFKRLFPEGEPEWEYPSFQEKPKGREEGGRVLTAPELQDEVSGLLKPVEDTLRAWKRRLQAAEERIKELEQEHEKPRAEWVAFVHTSPFFHGSDYDAKITSIKDTVKEMIQRAKHTIRISTLRIDFFADELILAKSGSPDLNISIITRGREDTKGDRSGIAKRAHDRMAQAGIKLLTQKELLHSRIVVIDNQEALVSSADLDLTQMELEFNAGIWTSDSETVNEAIRYFDSLIRFK